MKQEINQNELISKKHKKVCKIISYIEELLSLACTVTGCVSISAFCSLVFLLVDMASSEVGIKICVTTVVIKKYKSVITKQKTW